MPDVGLDRLRHLWPLLGRYPSDISIEGSPDLLLMDRKRAFTVIKILQLGLGLGLRLGLDIKILQTFRRYHILHRLTLR